MRRAGQKSEQIRFVKAMQINYRIEAAAAHIRDDFQNFFDRSELFAVAQFHPVNRNLLVGETGNLYDFRAGFTDHRRNFCFGKFFADGFQSRQTQYDIADLPEIDD